MTFFLMHVSFIINAQNVPNYVPTQGLVGWWNLDGNAIDSSGLNNHGKVYGIIGTSNRYGEQGKAVYFKGNKQRIEIPDHASLHSKQLTLSIWVKCDNEDLATIIYKANRKDGSSEVYSINNKPESGLKFFSRCKPAIGWNSVGFNSYNREYNLKNWTHLAITYDGVTLNQYVNGINVTRTIYNSDLDNCEESNIHLGYCWDKFPFSFNGSMDELGIWNRALSEQEVQHLFDSKTPKPPLQFLKLVPFKGYNRQTDTLQILYDSIHEILHLTFNKLENVRGHIIRVCDARDNRIEYLPLKELHHTLNVASWRLAKLRVTVIDPQAKEQGDNSIEGMDGSYDNYVPPYYFLKIFDNQGILKEVVRLW